MSLRRGPGPGPWPTGQAWGLGGWGLWPFCFYLDYSGPDLVSICGGQRVWGLGGGVVDIGQGYNPFLGTSLIPYVGFSLPSSGPLPLPSALASWGARSGGGGRSSGEVAGAKGSGNSGLSCLPFPLSLFLQEQTEMKVRLVWGRGKEGDLDSDSNGVFHERLTLSPVGPSYLSLLPYVNPAISL